MLFDPLWFLDILEIVLEAPFVQEEKKIEPPMKVVWEIGPGGYECGRCVPL